MEIKQEQAQQIVITDTGYIHNSFGAINVYLEDFGLKGEKYNACKVIIECDGELWGHYWSSMGCNLLEFISTASVEYITSKLLPSYKWFEIDDEKLISNLKRELLHMRRNKLIDDWEAREFYEDIESMTDITQEILLASYSDICEKLLGEDWREDIPRKYSKEYKHLENIVKAVKDAIIVIKDKGNNDK